jgi:nitroreductase
LITNRRSSRRFAPKIITDSELGRLLSVLAGPIAGRGYPSAGALYAIRTITILFSADRGSGRIVQHDPLAHSLTPIGDSPGWADLVDDLGGHDAESAPAAVVGLYADPGPMLAKYGERGGRFMLMEAGAVLLSLGMAAAELGLAGYPAGGGHDRRLLHLAGLSSLPARHVVSYFVGHPGE